MAKKFAEMADEHIRFVQSQHIFFVATAGAEGRVNLSPKGMDSLRIVDSKTAIWLNYTGSGNETSVHVQENSRMTLMFCSFEVEPLILRLYGQAKVIHPRDSEWDNCSGLFTEYVGTRQFFILNIDLVQTSCGYSVPFYDYQGEREKLLEVTERLGQEGVEKFWKKRNQTSLDGINTHIIEDE